MFGLLLEFQGIRPRISRSCRYQEAAAERNANKIPPSKPLLLKLQEKLKRLKKLGRQDYLCIFEDESLHLVFADTENNGHVGTMEYCRELSFYSNTNPLPKFSLVTASDSWLLYPV
jgi:hypothetical protein